MNRQWLMAICLVLVPIIGVPAASQAESKYLLLIPGQALDVPEAKSGQRWLGLFREADGYSLLLTRIEKKRWRDDTRDPSEGPVYYQHISTPDAKVEPIFLIKGPNLRERDSILVVHDKDLELGIGKHQILSKGVSSLTFEVSGKPKPDRPDNIENYELRLLGSGNRTVTAQRLDHGIAYDPPRLHWMGDLDCDGQLDFLMKRALGEGGGGLGPALYLSSAAEEGEIVHLVAVFSWDSGC